MRSALPMLTDSFREFDRMVDDFFGRDSGVPLVRSRKTLQYDLVQKSDSYDFILDLPGVKPEDIKLEVDGSTLKVEAERKSEEKKETETVLINNRSVGKVSHAFTLSDDIDASHVHAKYENGTLKVSLKKKSISKPRRIEIEAKPEKVKLQSA